MQDTVRENIKTKESFVRKYQWAIIRIVIVLVILWALFFFVIGLTNMPNTDMYPKVCAGDLILFSRLNKSPAAQELIVYKAKVENHRDSELLVSRVIAKEGDTVDISKDGVLSINGYAASEPDIHTPTKPMQTNVTYPITLKEGEYFVLADDREEGIDSRSVGIIKQQDILGTIITLVRRHQL